MQVCQRIECPGIAAAGAIEPGQPVEWTLEPVPEEPDGNAVTGRAECQYRINGADSFLNAEKSCLPTADSFFCLG